MGRIGQIAWNKGKKMSESHKRALSKSHKGKAGYWTGKKMSDELKEKLSKSHNGQTPWNKGILGEKSHVFGRELSNVIRQKISNDPLNLFHKANIRDVPI